MCGTNSLQEEAQAAQSTRSELLDLHAAILRLYNSTTMLHCETTETAGVSVVLSAWATVSVPTAFVVNANVVLPGADHVGFLAAVEDRVRCLERTVR